MTARLEHDVDLEIDSAFGDFISERRRSLNFGLHKAQSQTGIDWIRLRSLERGTSHRSATRHECELIAKGYGMELDTVLRVAAGS